jgi:AcrR family transcriptional regulator
MAASIEDKGYRETTVADVVRIARTSRRNFYEHFEDRDACFLALFDASNDAIVEQIAASVRADKPWEEQVEEALRIYLESVAARPGLSQSYVRELPALGKAGSARQRAVIARFADLLVRLVESGRREQPEMGVRPLTMEGAIIIVGGLRELTVMAIEEGRDVRELRPLAAQTVKAILSEAILKH